MSDPTFWTPPDSPEFVGTGAVFSEDFDVDLLAEIDALRLSLPVFGLSCDSLDSVSFLSHFENATTAPQWTDPLQILNLLRERIVCLKKYPTEYENESAVLRNDVSFLLSCLYSSTITKEFEKHVIVRMVARIRSILVFLGPLSCSLNPEVTGHLLHVHLETWIAVLKVFNFICEKTEYGVLVNETLGLKSRSSLNACGYFVDIVLENLILYSGVANDYKIAIHNSHGNCNKCSCDVFAWIVVIYLIEKSQKNWFKFFHGKMMKLSVHQKAISLNSIL
ncbi:unnamed protein product [Heterobilharzia americana]|nr:unnamed protein product [Heterobilharzia americana]